MSRKLLFTLLLSLGVVLSLGSSQFAFAQHKDPGEQYWNRYYGQAYSGPFDHSYQWDLQSQAQPDECFVKVGDPANLTSFQQFYGTGQDLPGGFGPVCKNGNSKGVPKVNQAYAWGMTTWGGRYIWFGTIANTLCQVLGPLVQQATGSLSPVQTNTFVCEEGKNGNWDQRPPRIFVYDTVSGNLTDMTPSVMNFNDGGASKKLLLGTGGLRSAGSYGNVVILAGLYGTLLQPSVVMFAFDAKNQVFLGSILFDGKSATPYAGVPVITPGVVAQFSDTRQWIVAKDHLYTGVATGASAGFGAGSGAILRWTGNVAQPFKFDIVGTVGADPAYLAFSHNRLFVNTWGVGGLNGQTYPAGSLGQALYLGPEFNCKGFLPASTASWGPPIFTYANYEREPSAAMGGGAIAAFQGDLYFTTMTPPGAQALQFQSLYPDAPKSDAALAESFLGSYRPTSMFRATNLDDPRHVHIDLLYGNAELPEFVDPTGKPCPTGTGHAAVQATCTWTMVPNKLHQTPQYGLAGYGNVFNSYTWWMHVYDHKLFIGTFDWSELLFETLFDQYGKRIPPKVIQAARQFEGADLLTINDSHSPAVPVSLNGLDNFANYGVRNMVTVGSDLYIGTANPFNLLTNPHNHFYNGKLGGWELIQLQPAH